VYSARVHQGQTRVSGEPYLNHLLWVSRILTDLRADLPTVIAGLLHDTLEDTWATREDLEENFGSEITQLVEGVTHLSQIRYSSRTLRQAENFRKMVVAMAKDVRVLLLKLADRLHNMRTLQHLPEDRRIPIAQETLDIFAPLAGRLGIFWLKSELEDRSFMFLEPEPYRELVQGMKEEKRLDTTEVAQKIARISTILEEAGIAGEVTGRVKHLYSIHQKMKKLGVTSLKEIYDLIAFRIVVKDIPTCYATLGVIHNHFIPIPGRIKDYIAIPKSNGYQSLHTTVIGEGGAPMEVQIRTPEMHRYAEMGVAAHWIYKNDGALDPREFEQYRWLRQLYDWQKELKEPGEFLEAVKLDLFQDEIYVFTPKGDLVVLPQGATAIDFAYKIHTDVGNRTRAVRINGRISPLRTPLKTGDIIEILTHPQAQPHRDWLKFVVTSSARAKIRAYLNKKERESALLLGEKLLKPLWEELNLPWEGWEGKPEGEKLIKELNLPDREKLLLAVGYGKISLEKIRRILSPPSRSLLAFRRFLPRRHTDEKKGEILVSGLEGVAVELARCCHPIPGDEILGIIRVGKGLKVHRRDCPHIRDLNPERLIPVAWEGLENRMAGERSFLLEIEILCRDQPGILGRIGKAMSDLGINIKEANIRGTEENKKARGTFHLEVKTEQEARQAIEALKKIPGILEVHRR
jgi:GTP pyrophosphokinase